MRCRVCHHDERIAIEAAAWTDLAEASERYGLSEIALDRHLAFHTRARAVVTEDECPPTSRSPGPVSSEVVVSTPDVGRLRSALLEALAHVDALGGRAA